MKNPLFYALLIGLILVYIAWPEKKAAVIEDNNGVHYTYGDTAIHFNKDQKTDAVYMVFGFQVENQILSNGYLALIPITTAKSLLSRYPDMNKCDSNGSEFAKKSIVDTMLIFNPQAPGLIAKANELKQVHSSSSYRICLRLQGNILQKTSAESRGREMIISDGGASYLYVSDMQQVSCNQ